jgi:cbb3-type cytochrome oxidase subunit 3
MTNAEMLYTAFTLVFCVVSFAAIYFAYDRPDKDE